MDERARKRRLDELEEDDEESDLEGVERELPKQGLKQPQQKKARNNLPGARRNGTRELMVLPRAKP